MDHYDKECGSLITDLLRNRRILVAVAHNDDLEFTVGGTLHQHFSHVSSHGSILSVVTFASREENTSEKLSTTLEHQAASFSILGIQGCLCENLSLRARFLPNYEDEIRLKLKQLREHYDPHVIFTHYREDPNQDHVSVCEQVLRVFPNHTVFGGEISNTGHRLRPTAFFALSEDNLRAKCRAVQSYLAESHKYYFRDDLVCSVARVRGGQSVSFEFAEAFEIYRLHSK